MGWWLLWLALAAVSCLPPLGVSSFQAVTVATCLILIYVFTTIPVRKLLIGLVIESTKIFFREIAARNQFKDQFPHVVHAIVDSAMIKHLQEQQELLSPGDILPCDPALPSFPEFDVFGPHAELPPVGLQQFDFKLREWVTLWSFPSCPMKLCAGERGRGSLRGSERGGGCDM